MLAVAEELGGPITVFGGEPLLLPLAHLRFLFAAGRDRLGGVSIQTNGTLVTDKHIALFREYGVRVGVSVDGPGDLNELRWAYSARATDSQTRASISSIHRLCQAGIVPSVIITLHKANASGPRLPRLLDWIRDLDRAGVRFVRLHMLESESSQIRDQYSLASLELLAAFQRLLDLERQLRSVRFDVFSDIRLSLDPSAGGAGTCVWNACDPYTTAAVQGIEGDGTLSNCGRTNKEGIEFLKAAAPSYERYLALYQTPYADGGCSGCRFFVVCKGQCAGTAIDGDWRNRTEHCDTWFGIMEIIEQELLAEGKRPLSQSEHRSSVERRLFAEWAAGRNPRPNSLFRELADHAAS
jgi:uncharacterized protein